MIRMLRALAIGTLVLLSANAAFGGELVEVWVVLSEPVVAGSPTAGQLERVERQQDRVMAELRALGATELARVALANNALAVTIDSSVAEAKRIRRVQARQRGFEASRQTSARVRPMSRSA